MKEGIDPTLFFIPTFERVGMNIDSFGKKKKRAAIAFFFEMDKSIFYETDHRIVPTVEKVGCIEVKNFEKKRFNSFKHSD